MGLFYPDLNGMGPGGTPDLREKRGLARFWEILTRDTWGLLASGLLAAVSVVPYVIGNMVSIDSHALLPMFITAPLGGMLAVPQLCGAADTVLRALRDEPGFWWRTYRRAWKQNVKGCLLPGAVGGLLFAIQIFILCQINVETVDLLLLFAMLLGVFVATAIATWLLPQLALMDLPTGRAVLNAILLSIRHPLKTLVATLLQLAYWGLIVMAFPDTLILFVLLNFWLPTLVVEMILYSDLDETFGIEESLGVPDGDGE